MKVLETYDRTVGEHGWISLFIGKVIKESCQKTRVEQWVQKQSITVESSTILVYETARRKQRVQRKGEEDEQNGSVKCFYY